MKSSKSKTSRRDFLAGKSAVKAIEDALPAEEPNTQGPAPSEAPQSYLMQIGRPAMACDFEVFFNAGQHPGATEAAVEALDLVDELESQMTVYRSHSEVLTINRLASGGPVVVEKRLFQLLQRAVELHGMTGGAFDVTSGPLSKAWGFFRRAGQFPMEEEIEQAKSRVGSQWLALDPETCTMRFRLPDLEINLNAIGKGYALDRCAELLLERNVQNFMIHGGHSSILARGSRASPESDGKGWLVSVKHPYKTEQRLLELWLRDRALGTSGAGNQYFHFQGRRYGHVIDPRTGWPADRVLSATVLAPDAATADALATAFFVMGVDESLAVCESHPELAAIFVFAGARAGEVEVQTHGLQADEWQRIT